MEKYFRFKTLKFNWQFGLILILVFGIPRFLIVMEANRTSNYQFTSLLFLAMCVTPFLLLKKAGRRTIGMKGTNNYKWLLYSFLLGILACTLVFLIGNQLFHHRIENWFVYISQSYSNIPNDVLTGDSKAVYFMLFALIGMTFSPIGEELLYRGLIHHSFVPELGSNRASMVDSFAFAMVHLAHFGLVYTGGVWKFLWFPALLWMVLMFFTSRLFFYCKRKTGSIYAAILSHAGFNLAMTYFIFYHIL